MQNMHGKARSAKPCWTGQFQVYWTKSIEDWHSSSYSNDLATQLAIKLLALPSRLQTVWNSHMTHPLPITTILHLPLLTTQSPLYFGLILVSSSLSLGQVRVRVSLTLGFPPSSTPSLSLPPPSSPWDLLNNTIFISSWSPSLFFVIFELKSTNHMPTSLQNSTIKKGLQICRNGMLVVPYYTVQATDMDPSIGKANLTTEDPSMTIFW